MKPYLMYSDITYPELTLDIKDVKAQVLIEEGGNFNE